VGCREQEWLSSEQEFLDIELGGFYSEQERLESEQEWLDS
jgi:hypothetical protein